MPAMFLAPEGFCSAIDFEAGSLDRDHGQMDFGFHHLGASDGAESPLGSQNLLQACSGWLQMYQSSGGKLAKLQPHLGRVLSFQRQNGNAPCYPRDMPRGRQPQPPKKAGRGKQACPLALHDITGYTSLWESHGISGNYESCKSPACQAVAWNVWHDEDLLGVEDLQKVAVILVSSLYMEFSFAVGSRRP